MLRLTKKGYFSLLSSESESPFINRMGAKTDPSDHRGSALDSLPWLYEDYTAGIDGSVVRSPNTPYSHSRSPIHVGWMVELP